tara:strand:- start:502 stop:741 length:240 start_codon:yes stop_codon:yes gene_type:complete
MAVMKDIIQKQILEWKEELAKQIQTKNQAEKVLAETSKTILLIEGGIQAIEMLLKKIEQESQQEDTKELKQQSKPTQSN